MLRARIYWLSMALLALSPTAIAQTVAGQKDSERLLEQASSMIRGRQYQEAKALLLSALKEKPEGWRAVGFEGDKLVRAYWDTGDFLRCSPVDGATNKKDILWRGPSYSGAYYLLAYMLQEEGDLEGALNNLNTALTLEPDSPPVLIELGNLQASRGNAKAAVPLFEKALQRSCTGESLQASAYRGLGVALVELGDLDAAERALQTSLKLAPGNKNAESELQYIDGLRRGKAKGQIVPAYSNQ